MRCEMPVRPRRDKCRFQNVVSCPPRHSLFLCPFRDGNSGQRLCVVLYRSRYQIGSFRGYVNTYPIPLKSIRCDKDCSTPTERIEKRIAFVRRGFDDSVSFYPNRISRF